MEETLSTLDYALRAKSITNKPEVNQRMTRNSLLKEYVAEIERLKSDLLAAREKNGIFFSEETWNQMTVEQELRSTELEEAKKQTEIVENQMRAVQEEFEQSVGLLKIREGELSEMRAKLKHVDYQLGQREEELVTTKGALEEEVVVRKAHHDTEVILDGVAMGLRNVAQQSVHDVSELLQKLGEYFVTSEKRYKELMASTERKTKMLKSNSHAVSTNGRMIATSTHTLSQKLDDFVKLISQSALKLRSEGQDFQTKELRTLASYTERVDQQFLRLQHALLAIQSSDASEAEALDVVRKILAETHQTFKTSFGAWSERFKRTCEELSTDVKLAGMEALGRVEAELKTMGSLVDAVVREARGHINADLETAHAAKALASENCRNEVARLRQQNETLVALLESERLKADNAKDELVRRLSVFLGDFTVDRDRSLREAFGAIQSANQKRESETGKFAEQHSKLMEQIQTDGTEVNGQLQKRSGEGKRTRDGAFKVSPQANILNSLR
jgi:kinesin family member 11